jgi:ribosomal protein S18 acetylase RimI-like enzyme
MRIRKLTLDDYDEIASLWNKAGLPYKSKGRDNKTSIGFQMKKNPSFFLGAHDEDKLVGVVIASYDHRRGWINRLAVHPDCRRKGVAKKLIATAEKALRNKGAKVICAQVEENNYASLSLFKKCGYSEHRDVVYFSKRDSDEI